MNLPNRASDAGPEPKDPGYEWRDYLDFAAEAGRKASRVEARSAIALKLARVHDIESAIAHLERAKELLCR